MPISNEFKFLLEKYLNDELNEYEIRHFFQLLNEFSNDELNGALFSAIYSDTVRDSLNDRFDLSDEYLSDKIQVWENIKHLGIQNEVKHIKRPLARYISITKQVAIAALFLIIGYCSYLLITRPKLRLDSEIVTQKIAPSKDESLIVLPNGKEVLINNDKNGVLYHDDKVKISRKENDEIVFEYADETVQQDIRQTIAQTSAGGFTSIVLPDGSKVWLNSLSKLTFPSKFNNDSREVLLDGEAYFEIVKNESSPFLVKTSNQVVKVLGTKFNLRSYADEDMEFTTLLEGKVSLSMLNSTQTTEMILLPGYQAINNYKEFYKIAVHATNYIGWVNRRFLFNDIPLPLVLKDIERWYDVKFVSNENLPLNLLIYGNLSKDLLLDEILKVLSKNTNYTFVVKERRVIMSRQ